MITLKNYAVGIGLTIILAFLSIFISGLIPNELIGAGVFALLIGMLLNPVISKHAVFEKGLGFTAKKVLRISIVLMGLGLSFSQVFQVGKYSLIVMIFTLCTAFGGGYLLGKLFKMNWKLSSLISAGTGVCGGSAIAAIAPVIEAKDSDIAYGISATFIFDVIMVVLFPIMGQYFNMSDVGYGLWAGTAVNDTSSVVAAGYAFSDAAGQYSTIVKLTRTLSIVPIVLIFSYINQRVKRKAQMPVSTEVASSMEGNQVEVVERQRVDLKKIFPWFILMFLVMVGIKSTGFIPDAMSSSISDFSKFLMVMSLGAIGLRTNFTELAKSGFTPMLHGFFISTLVVIVSFLAQLSLGLM